MGPMANEMWWWMKARVHIIIAQMDKPYFLQQATPK